MSGTGFQEVHAWLNAVWRPIHKVENEFGDFGAGMDRTAGMLILIPQMVDGVQYEGLHFRKLTLIS